MTQPASDASPPTSSSWTKNPSGSPSRSAPRPDRGTWQLHLRFRGVLNDKLKGFYRSTFVDTDGNDQVIATTQFEATDARRALPLLGRARAQGGLRHHARGRRRPDGTVERPRAGPRTPRQRQGRGDLRRHDEDVDLPGRVHRRARSMSPTPVDVDGTPLRVAYPRGKGHLTDYALEVGGSPSTSSPTTTASSIRATSSTSSPYPTSRSVRWRTSAA